MSKHSGLEYCVEAADQYCMYKKQTLEQIEPLAPATLKTCHIKSPKIKDAKTLRGEDEYEEFSDFVLFIEMGSNREFSQEYLIYDTLSLIGTLGGTLGLFVGFSFYDFLTMITSFILKKVSSKVLTLRCQISMLHAYFFQKFPTTLLLLSTLIIVHYIPVSM